MRMRKLRVEWWKKQRGIVILSTLNFQLSTLNLPMSGLLCIGHRGACGHEPENTLRSIRRALELGAQGVEIDVRFVDGELVVFHDARLERTTNGRGQLARKSFADLRALDAGLGERIPTL